MAKLRKVFFFLIFFYQNKLTNGWLRELEYSSFQIKSWVIFCCLITFLTVFGWIYSEMRCWILSISKRSVYNMPQNTRFSIHVLGTVYLHITSLKCQIIRKLSTFKINNFTVFLHRWKGYSEGKTSHQQSGKHISLFWKSHSLAVFELNFQILLKRYGKFN